MSGRRQPAISPKRVNKIHQMLKKTRSLTSVSAADSQNAPRRAKLAWSCSETSSIETLAQLGDFDCYGHDEYPRTKKAFRCKLRRSDAALSIVVARDPG